MKLYYMKAACSLASNICLREAGLKFELAKVDRKTRIASDGVNYRELNPKGYVPALQLDDGQVLTENDAVLQYIADRNPAANLAPPQGSFERYRLIEWLSFISTELHKSFTPIFRAHAADAAKDYARTVVRGRLDYLEKACALHSFLMSEHFTVADAYLYVVLGWGDHVDVSLSNWPKLKRFHERVGVRPCVIEALKSEGLLQ